jgi:hypothetical protein
MTQMPATLWSEFPQARLLCKLITCGVTWVKVLDHMLVTQAASWVKYVPGMTFTITSKIPF